MEGFIRGDFNGAHPVLEKPALHCEDVGRARELIQKYGWNAVAYQILNPGISLWFSDSGEGVVGYVAWKGVRVVAGAPVCPESELPEVVSEFEAEASSHGHHVCYFAAGSRLEGILGGLSGYARVRIGAQPVWRPERWQAILSGRPSLRAQLYRFRNQGMTVRELPPGEAAENPDIRRCLEEWLAGRPMPSLHFLVEPQILDRLWDRRVFAAEGPRGPVGFLVATPIPQRRGWLIEEIIRGRAAPNGTAEALIDAAFLAALEGGIEYFTLGLAPLTRLHGPMGNDPPKWLNVAFALTRLHGSRFYNFRGLEWFKAKFEPERWEPIYAICNQGNFSPRFLFAIAAAFGGMSPWLFLGKTLALALRRELSRLRRMVAALGKQMSMRRLMN